MKSKWTKVHIIICFFVYVLYYNSTPALKIQWNALPYGPFLNFWNFYLYLFTQSFSIKHGIKRTCATNHQMFWGWFIASMIRLCGWPVSYWSPSKSSTVPSDGNLLLKLLRCSFLPFLFSQTKLDHMLIADITLLSLLSYQHLDNLNNFNLLMAFISGMNNSCILRLKWTKSLLSKKSLEVSLPSQRILLNENGPYMGHESV